jgi:hypothetical protein
MGNVYGDITLKNYSDMVKAKDGLISEKDIHIDPHRPYLYRRFYPYHQRRHPR